VLQVEEGGHGARRAREGRVGRDVAHALAAHPDLAIVLQTLQELFACAGHGGTIGGRAPVVKERTSGAIEPRNFITPPERITVRGHSGRGNPHTFATFAPFTIGTSAALF